MAIDFLNLDIDFRLIFISACVKRQYLVFTFLNNKLHALENPIFLSIRIYFCIFNFFFNIFFLILGHYSGQV